MMLKGSGITKCEVLGFSVGGAMDISNFREKVEHSQKFAESDLTYEGIFHEYYFDISQKNDENKNNLFVPVYSSASCENILTKEKEVFLNVGLSSNIKEIKRPDMDVVVVLE